MAKPSFYELLGLPETCTGEEIDAAYRRGLASIHAGAAGEEAANQQAFLRFAYEVLADPARRRQYDQQRAAVAAAAMTAAKAAPEPDASRWSLRLLGAAVVVLAAAGWTRFAGNPPEAPAASAPTRTVSPAVAVPGADPRDAPAESSVEPAEAGREVAADSPTAKPAASVVAGRRYTITVDSADAELITKLVWSVYAIVGEVSLGTGILIAPERLLTNCHVLVGNTLKGPIYAINSVTRERVPITQAAFLPNEDACLVHAPGLGGETVVLGSSAQLKVGTRLHNIGYPQGKLGASEGVFTGWINLHGQPFIVSNNYCAPGVSGGPLVDDAGRLVGLTTGASEDRSRCASLTIETARQVLAQPLLAIDAFPRQYASNVSRKGN